jgi:hypothetical protein
MMHINFLLEFSMDFMIDLFMFAESEADITESNKFNKNML